MVIESEKLKIRTLARGISSKLFNQQVNDRYKGNDDLLTTCLIQPFDTIPEIVDKKLTFYFVLDNFTPQVKEKLVVRNKSTKSDNLPWMILHIKFKEKYIEDSEAGELKPLGQRRIRVSNIDENLIVKEDIQTKLDRLTLKFGSSWISYNFKNKKEIRLEHLSTRAEGVKLIKLVLPFTIKEHLHEGEVEDNVFNVNPPKNTPKLDTHGLTGHIFKATFHKREGKKVNKIATIYLSNAVSANKY